MPQKNTNSNNSETPKNAYFLSLELENVRCFGEKQKIDFSDGRDKPRQWTIILGDNGTGKTTLLQCLVATKPYTDFAEFTEDEYKEYSAPFVGILPYTSTLWKPFRKEASKASSLKTNFIAQRNLLNTEVFDIFVLGASNQASRSSIVNYWSFSRLSDILATLNCFAYGASRKTGKTSLSEQNENSAYATLFDETMLLINPEEWLISYDYASKRESKFQKKRRFQLEKVKETLIKILPDIDEIRFSEKEQPDKQIPKVIVEFHTHYGWVEAKDLSLGYRTSMAWMVDFASRMFDLYPESENPLAEPAVVLIDEIDLHLHPKWQRDLLPWLSELFPNTQFIVTTHSPLIVQSAVARDANIVVCRREGDHVVIDQSVEAVKNWRADQILTSDLFGLETARPKETGALLKEKERILSKARLTKKDEKRLTELDEKIGFLPVSENSEDDEAMEIIRKAADWVKTQTK